MGKHVMESEKVFEVEICIGERCLTNFPLSNIFHDFFLRFNILKLRFKKKSFDSS